MRLQDQGSFSQTAIYVACSSPFVPSALYACAAPMHTLSVAQQTFATPPLLSDRHGCQACSFASPPP